MFGKYCIIVSLHYLTDAKGAIIMKILNFGSCNLDYVYRLNHITAEGETQQSEGFNIYTGGKGLNQSIAAARAGAKVFHAGCVGSDGDMLTDVMSQSGIDVSYVKRLDEKNGHAIIQVSDKGENSIIVFPGTNKLIDKQHIDFVLGNFECGDIVILQNEINNVEYIIKKAYKRSLTVILNPSPIGENLFGIDFNMISYLVLNEIEAKALFGCQTAEESVDKALMMYPSLKIVLTLGSKGSMYKSSDESVFQHAFKVDAVDTTAAGDTFMGYFAAGLVRNLPVSQILKIASAASAVAVSKHGAAPSIPCISTVEEKLAAMTESV